MTELTGLGRRAFLGGAVAAGALGLGACGEDTAAAPTTPDTPAPPKDPGTGFVTVPGARIYYEIHGSGQTLLMIHPGSGEAGSWSALAPIMAERYRVVTYDRRGNSRSTVDTPPAEAPPALHADDAVALLHEIGGGPAHVLGSSAGAIVALDLAARYADRLRTVISHEPPVFEVLPDPAPYRRLTADTYDTYLREGVEPAFLKFFSGQGAPPGAPEETEPGVDPRPDPAMAARSAGNDEFFIAREMRAFMGYRPDIEAVRASSARVVIGVGRPRDDDLVAVARTAADRTGRPLVEFPGAHVGFSTHPKGFAARLDDVLNGR